MKWLPLPKIAHGIAIYPFIPSSIQKEQSTATRYSGIQDDASISSSSSLTIPSSTTTSSTVHSTNIEDYSQLIALEVGDELFIIEQKGQWYRGYVISTMEEGKKPTQAPLGLFPKSFVSIKEYIDIDNDDWIPISNKRTSRPITELPRSFSESFLQGQHNNSLFNDRPNSFGDLPQFAAQEKAMIPAPPPALPTSRFEQSTVTGNSEPLVDEIAACVSEWNSLLYKYINSRNYSIFNMVRDDISYLFQARRQLLDQALSREELTKLRKEIIYRMCISNLNQNQAIIIRQPEKGYLLDIENSSLSNIYRMHYKYAQQQQQTTVDSNMIIDDKKGAKFHHLYFELKACVAHICQIGELTELYFTLYSATEKKFLTEQFVVVLNYNGMPKDESQIGKLQSLFIELSQHDVNDDLYLVCHIVRFGGMKLSTEKDHSSFYAPATHLFHSNKHTSIMLSPATTSNCRRPFGCAVLKLNNFMTTSSVDDTNTANNSNVSTEEFDMPIYTCINEATFVHLHQDIIFNNIKEYQKNSRADMLRISLKSYYGYLDQVVKTNHALQDMPQTLRLGFVDVVFPNDCRNELYITLDSGDFMQFGTKYRNIQVCIQVRDNRSGDTIENAISIGAGTRLLSSWESMVMYHEQKPKWNETIKICIQDIHQWERSHLYVTVKHIHSHQSNNSKSGDANEKIIAMGFLPLFLPPLHRDFIADGVHTLNLFKYVNCSNPKMYLESLPWCARSSSPSNMMQQQFIDRIKSPPLTTKFGHQHSPSSHSFKSNSGSFTSAFNPTSTATSISDITVTQQPTNGKMILLRDNITLSSFLCSNQFTQNKTLVKLLNWKTLIEGTEDGITELLSVLDEFTFVGEVEVVKFLGDIFDALLDILVYNQENNLEINHEMNDQVLASIIWLLGIVQDRRFSNFRPVLDVYIETRFKIEQEFNLSNPNYSYRGPREITYEQLLKSLVRLCDDSVSRAKLLRSSMKVWDYLFRFIVSSRLNQQKKEDYQERAVSDANFKQELNTLLLSITAIMSPDQPNSMIGTQTLCLQHFHDILNELSKLFSSKEILEITISFIDKCNHVTGRLVGFKLAMILIIVKISFSIELTQNVFRWIRLWLNSYQLTANDVIFARQEHSDFQQTRLPRAQWMENLRLSITILSLLLDKLRKSFGMSSFTVSSPITSSRPTSFSTINNDNEDVHHSDHELNNIIQEALQLVPQLLNAYKETQKMTIQAMLPINALETIPTNSTRPHSRQSFSMRRERASSINNNMSKNPILSQDILQELKTASSGPPSPSGNTSTTNHVVLQALATSPATPFPSTYPFQPTNRTKNAGLHNNIAAMMSTGLLDLTVVILELFYLTPKQQWIHFIRKMYDQDGLDMTADFLRKIVYTCMAILFGDDVGTLEQSSLQFDGMSRCEEDESRSRRKLPHHWLNLSTIAHQIVMCNILEPIKTILELNDFVPTERAYHEDENDSMVIVEDSQESLGLKGRSIEEQRSALLLWRVYFVGFLRVEGSSRLEVPEFMPQEQRAVWKIAGDIRGKVGAKTFLSLWQLAGGRKKAVSQQRSRTTSNDYFGHDFVHVSPVTEHTYFSEDSLRKSMASIEEVEDDDDRLTVIITPPTSTYSIRNSIRIAPTDELPLSSIHEADLDDISFLQADLSYFILGSMCAVSLTLHDRVRTNAFIVIADIIAVELYQYGELHYVQHALISTLDRLIMSEDKGDEAIYARMAIELSAALEQRLLADDRHDLVNTGKKAVDSLCKFMGLLLQIRSLPGHDDEFMDERITATLKLMKFIQVIEREEIYIKYVHQLVQLHLDSRNFIEAALTLQFHADLLHWDPTDKLAAITDLGLSSQSSFARKEGLYLKMITYLDQGSAWEICVKLCKELAYEYENTLYDYSKLSDILQRQASLAENIVKKERCFTEYFRVGFYGRGFPASNRNRQYIYRGLEWEKMPSFVERMQNRHPNAQLLPSKVSNSIHISEEQLKELESTLDGQYLQITSVTPVPDIDGNACLSNTIAPDGIKKYYYFNNVSKFSFSRPVIRESTNESKQPESDFLNLWTEKVDFECEDRFPTIVRRSKIIQSNLSVVSPIENAVTAMENKNKELVSLEKKYSAYLTNRRSSSGSSMHSNQAININPFSMSLNGAVDAPVNGGVPLYKKAFLSKEYWDKNPDMRQWIHRLQSAIHDQVKIIKKCLDTHNKLVSVEMRPFHTTLMEFFNKNFAYEIKSLKSEQEAAVTEQAGAPLSITTSSSRRRSTLSSSTTTENSNLQQPDDSITSLKSISRQNSTLSQTPGIGGVPVLPALPVMSPISRAFSIRTPVTESAPPTTLPTTPNSLNSSLTNFENATMSRAESLSRSLKMSLRSKKSRKKSPASSIIPPTS